MPSRSVAGLNSSGQRVEDASAAITNTTSAAASTPKILGTLLNIARWDSLLIRLSASSALAGGNCDYVGQRLVDGPNGTTWDDYIYFGQQVGGAASDFVALINNLEDFSSYGADKGDVTWVRHDDNTDATLALAAGERRPGPIGPQLRIVSRTLAGVNAAATVNVYVTGISKDN